MKKEILIGLGGNLPSHIGSPLATIRRALELLADCGLGAHKCSGVYKTKPVPVSDQPDFINVAVLSKTDKSPEELLELFQKIEVGCGRKPAERWSARTLDVDLLAYGQGVFPELSSWQVVVDSSDPAAILPEPVVPHPRLHKRAFVLLPLLDIAPNWKHPVLGFTVRELVKNELSADDKAGVVKVSQSLS